MPQLNDVIAKSQKKKFVKKNYRPWDLSGSGSSPPSTAETLPTAEDTSAATVQATPIPPPELASEIEHTKLAIEKVEKKEIESPPQLDNKKDNNQVTIREQLDNNQVTIREHLDNKSITKQETIREQLDNALNPNSLKNKISKLSGIQKKILYFVTDICTIKTSLETGPFETQLISQYIQTSYGATKTSIIRLISKGFLKRLKGKTAKGGFINLSIPQEVKEVILALKGNSSQQSNSLELLNSLREQTGNKLDNNSYYISSSNINTTTREQPKLLPKDWETINYDPLVEIGFSKTQLKQLIDKSSSEVVQESIYHFAFGLAHNKKFEKYTDPLNVLMGVLRKGQAWVEPNYRSTQEIALENYLTQKKMKYERLMKIENELFSMEYQKWKLSLTKEEKESVIPKEIRESPIPSTAMIEVSLQTYFKEHFWPSLRPQELD